MKTQITIIAIIFLSLTTSSLHAQIDQDKMDQDVRVASKVLESLTHGDNRLMMYSDNVEGNYLADYGVIFSIGGGYSYTGGEEAYSIARSGNTDSTVIIALKNKDKSDKDVQGEDEDKFEDLSKIMLEFLIDYSQMINQLKPTDKIVVSTKKSDYVYTLSTNDDEESHNGSSGITAEMIKGDHNDYMAGKISRDQLQTKIKLNKKNGEANRSKDLDLFSAMLSTVYDDEYTDSYFVSWKPEYERIHGVGAIYSFKVYSSYDEDGLFRMPGIDKKGLNADDRNAEVVGLYPIFVQSMKENIIQYGRTISTLEADELVLIKVTLTKCDECTIPKKVQFSVKQSVLRDYNMGKISAKDATEKVKVSEL